MSGIGGSDVQVPPVTSGPKQVECSCGRLYDQVWYDVEQRRADGRWVPKHWKGGRWVAPAINPCGVCASTDAHEREVLARLKGAKVPHAYYGYTLRNSDVLKQESGEADRDFQARCKGKGKFGAYEQNFRALGSIRQWLNVSPDEWYAKPPKRWAVLHGEPGTGKTAMLGAIARCLLSVPPMVKVELPPHRLRHLDLDEPREGETEARWQERVDRAIQLGLNQAYARARVPDVRYVDASVLLRRHQQAFGKERDAEEDTLERDVMSIEVLLLDEFGAGAKVTEGAYALFDRIVRTRHNEGKLTVIGTNRSWSELTERGKSLFGDAVADRLGSALRVPLGGPSWR